MAAIRIGVIGCGVMGTRHATYAKEHADAEVVAVADIIPERAEKIARELGVSKTYPSGEVLLEDAEVDAVTLAMPACLRTELALKAFSRGKHVLTEKPVAMNADEVRKMIAAKGDLIAGACCGRSGFLPSNEFVADLIARGVLGRIRSIHARYMMPLGERTDKLPPEWRLRKHRNGGGILMNWGCYDLDYLLGITGWRLTPETVFGQTWPIPDVYLSRAVPDSDAETHFVAMIRCAGGEMITLERAEYVTTTEYAACKIVGGAASLHLQMLAGEGKKIVLDKGDPDAGVVSEVVWEEPLEEWATMHRSPVHDFIDAIRDKRPCRTSLEKALIVQQISDAVYESAEKGQSIRIT